MGIYVALGANLPSQQYGSPRETLEAALESLRGHGIAIAALSPWYVTAPVPKSDQPDFVNAVAEVETAFSPPTLLAVLHETEETFGRVRKVRNEARVIDLDLIAYNERVTGPADGAPNVPHPRMHERAFVLLPLRDIAPDWQHPRLGKSIGELIEGLPQPWGVRAS